MASQELIGIERIGVQVVLSNRVVKLEIAVNRLLIEIMIADTLVTYYINSYC
jgi:hypothetical protein